MNNGTKKQHYVPCCYLAFFGANGNEKRKSIIYAYDITTKAVISGTVESFAFSNSFYDIDFVDQKLIEQFFAKVEGDLVEVLKTIDEHFSMRIMSLEQKDMLSAHLALLFVRTKKQRDRYDMIIQQMDKAIPNVLKPVLYDDYKERLREIHTMDILSFKTATFMTNLLMDRKWILWKNETSVPFYTSDNPVCIIYHERETASIISPSVEIYIPLSPDTALSAYHKDINPSIGDRSVAGIRDIRIVDSFNNYLMADCSRFIFSNKNTFDSYKEEN